MPIPVIPVLRSSRGELGVTFLIDMLEVDSVDSVEIGGFPLDFRPGQVDDGGDKWLVHAFWPGTVPTPGDEPGPSPTQFKGARRRKSVKSGDEGGVSSISITVTTSAGDQITDNDVRIGYGDPPISTS